MKIGLFALTGFGNAVLRALIQAGFKPSLVVTRKEKGPHPYYPEKDLGEEALENQIPVYYGAEGEVSAANEKLDVILTATYHRILKPDLVRTANYAFNIHPSLLPAYRGASPIFWALRNGETATGVTIHFLTSKVDEGDILFQQSIEINSQDETQGSLRFKLATLAGDLSVQLLSKIRDTNTIPEQIAQDSSQASSYPKLGEEQRVLDLNLELVEILRHFRALHPWPGAILDGKRIERIQNIRSSGVSVNQAGKILSSNDAMITVQTKDAEIDFKLASI